MWTTAQEVDNDMYHGRLNGNGQDDNPYYDSITNPWKLVANYINKYDAYSHPQTAHMEYVSFTSVSNSSFKNLQGHSWFGVQWAPEKIGQLDFKVPKDFGIMAKASRLQTTKGFMTIYGHWNSAQECKGGLPILMVCMG